MENQPPVKKFWPPSRKTWLLVAAGLAVLVVIGGAASYVMDQMAGAPSPRSAVTQSKGITLGLTSGAAPQFAAMDAAEESAVYSRGAEPMPPIMPPSGGQTAAEVDQKIIKNGSLQVVVDDVGESIARITALAGQKNGFVQNSSVSERRDGTHYGQITVRVPARDFEASMSEIKTYAAVVKNETATGQDVTEQYTDLEAQLRNARAQEQTYLAVLDKAKTVEDILKVQQHLGQIRGTIESLQGRLKYLENVTSFSTISVSLEEEPVVRLPTKEFRPLSSIKEAFQSLVEALQGLVITVIWVVILGGGLLLPVVLLVLIIVLIVRKIRRKRQ